MGNKEIRENNSLSKQGPNHCGSPMYYTQWGRTNGKEEIDNTIG